MRCQKLKIPEGLHLELIRAHTPELQPAERLWPVINEAISNQTFENLSQLEDIVNDRCINNHETAFVKRAGGNRSQTGLTCFRWWPTDNLSRA